jgi:hypothetical protein
VVVNAVLLEQLVRDERNGQRENDRVANPVESVALEVRTPKPLHLSSPLTLMAVRIKAMPSATNSQKSKFAII